MKSNLSITEKLILFFVLRTKGNITKTQLTKFLYLADLYAVKWLGQQLTGLKWIYYDYGPWEESLDDILSNLTQNKMIELSKQNDRNQEKDYTLIKLGEKALDEKDLALQRPMEFMLENIRKQWAAPKKIQKLLYYIYETAPIKDAKKQGYLPKDKHVLDLYKEHEKLLQDL